MLYCLFQNKEIKLAKGKYEVSDLEMGSEIKYTIRPVGMYLAVEASLGITVLWDRKTTIRILVEPQHSVSSTLVWAVEYKLFSCLTSELFDFASVIIPFR